MKSNQDNIDSGAFTEHTQPCYGAVAATTDKTGVTEHAHETADLDNDCHAVKPGRQLNGASNFEQDELLRSTEANLMNHSSLSSDSETVSSLDKVECFGGWQIETEKNYWRRERTRPNDGANAVKVDNPEQNVSGDENDTRKFDFTGCDTWSHRLGISPTQKSSRNRKSVQFTGDCVMPSQNLTKQDADTQPAEHTPAPLVLLKKEMEADDTNDKVLKSPLTSSDEAYYDTASSTSSTTALLKKVAHTITGEDTKFENELVKRAAAGTTLENLTSGGGLELKSIHPEFQTGLGKAILSETLDQVKRSLEELAPGHATEKSKFEDQSSVKLRNNYMKNLLVLSMSFMLVYCPFYGVRNLQSSINHKDGLGLVSMASMGAGFIGGCVIGASIVGTVRPKWSLLGAMVGFQVYLLANFHATFYTLIPATVLLGMTMATMWIAQGTYLTSIAISYAVITSNKPEQVLAMFNGIFLFFLQLAQIIGNLLSSIIINNTATSPVDSRHHGRKKTGWPGYMPAFDRAPSTEVRGTHHFNNNNHQWSLDKVPVNISSSNLLFDHVTGDSTSQLTNETWNKTICGSNYCHKYDIDHVATDISMPTLFVLLGTFTILTLLGMLLLAVFLDKLDVIFQKKKVSACEQMLSLARLHRHPHMLLFIPMAVFLGLQEAFAYGEFTKGYITCPLSLHMIGYVMMCFGACDSIAAFATGLLPKCNRKFIIAHAVVVHIVLLVALYFFPLTNNVKQEVFILAGVLGVVDALWQSQACSLCGLLFKEKEATFAVLRMYESFGFSLATSYAQFICMDVKLIMVGGSLVVTAAAYVILEWSLHKSQTVTASFV